MLTDHFVNGLHPSLPAFASLLCGLRRAVDTCRVGLQQLLVDQHRVDRRSMAEVVPAEGLLWCEELATCVGLDGGPVVVPP